MAVTLCALGLTVLGGSLAGCATGAPDGIMTTERESLGESDVGSLRATSDAVVRCLDDAGWKASVDATGMVVSEPFDVSKEAEYESAFDKCVNLVAPRVDATTTPDEWIPQIYEEEMDTAECLRGLGVEVPPAPPFEEFAARYFGEQAWYGYNYVGEVSEDRWVELNRVCPQPGS